MYNYNVLILPNSHKCVISEKIEFSNLFRISSSYPEQWLICWQWRILENFLKFKLPFQFLIYSVSEQQVDERIIYIFGSPGDLLSAAYELTMFHAIRKRRSRGGIWNKVANKCHSHTASLCFNIFKSLFSFSKLPLILKLVVAA